MKQTNFSKNTNWYNEIDQLNSLITIKEMEFIIKILLKKKSPCPDDFIREFYQIFKEALVPVQHNIFQKIEGRMLSIPFMWLVLTWYQLSFF